MIEKQALNKMAIKPPPLMHPEGIKERGWGRVKSVVQTLLHPFRPAQNSYVTSQPIMSAQEIAAWGQELEAYWSSLPPSKRLSELALFGDQSSRFRGQGMEYEESRAYQPGDELRHLNWRLMARSGKAFTKLFQEERQAQWVIVLDQRQSMRFGTRGRLKVTQGLRIAGWLAWMAQQQRVRIQAVGLSESVSLTPVLQGMNLYPQVMQALAIPCPPSQHANEPQMTDVLNQLKIHWPNGSRIWLISDFADLTANDQAWLQTLNQSWSLHAFFVQDKMEHTLPGKYGLNLTDGEQTYSLNAEQQAQYTVWAYPEYKKRAQLFNQNGIQVRAVFCHHGLKDIVQSASLPLIE